MSQGGAAQTVAGSGGGIVQTLTGNTGGPVSPAGGNINILANTTMGITTVGTPALHQINIVGIQATTSQIGVVELASNAQAIAGTDTNNAITSAALAAKLGTQTAHSLAVFEGTSSAITALGVASNGQLPIGQSGADPVLATLTAGTGITITNGAGSITIASSATNYYTYTGVTHLTSPYTVLLTDEYLGVDTTGGVVTIKLPNAPSTGQYWIIKDKLGDANTNNITVTTVGGAINIDGNTSYVMNMNYQAINVLFNGATYEVF